MKKIAVVLFLAILFSTNIKATENEKMNQNIDALIDAIAQVESNGNPAAISKDGTEKGLLQITQIYVNDVNRICGTSYIHDDAFDPEKAKEMAKAYLSYYSEVYKRKTGKEATFEVMARMHNGGPNGWNKECTVPYWNKVKTAGNF